MTPEAFTATLKTLGWSMNALARRLGCFPVIVQRWAAGEANIPASIEHWLTNLAGHVKRHPPPQWRSR